MIDSKPQVSLVVRNYNGIRFLQDYLEGMLQAAEASTHRAEVLVVDDASKDESVAYVRDSFPAVRLVPLENNVGYARASNAGVAQAKGEIVICLDNDVRVAPDFVDPLVSHFADERVFSVNSKVIVPRLDHLNESVKVMRVHHGMLYLGCVQNPPESAIPILYATGCAAAFRRSTYLEVGGFDPLFRPLYWEDTDLGYKARKRGYEVMYEPLSRVEHWYSGSTTPENKRRMAQARAKNSILFIWKNITDSSLFRKHIAYLPFVLIKAGVARDSDKLLGFCAALRQLSEARAARSRERQAEVVGDAELLERFGGAPPE